MSWGDVWDTVKPAVWVLAGGAAVLAVQHVDAAELEVGLGVSHVQPPPDSLWWESGFEHSLKMTSPAASIGLRGSNWRVGYQFVGHYSTDSIDMIDEAAWKAGARDCAGVTASRFHTAAVNQSAACSHFQGSGDVQGIYTLWTPQLTDKLRVEVGPFFQYNTWHVAYSLNAPAQAVAGVTGGTGPYYPKWNVGGMLGLSYQVSKHFSVAADYVALDVHGGRDSVPPGYRHGATLFEVRWNQ